MIVAWRSATLLVAVLIVGCDVVGALAEGQLESVVENRTAELIVAGVDEGLNPSYLRFVAVPRERPFRWIRKVTTTPGRRGYHLGHRLRASR
jgi:hypothetical protein